MKKLMMAVLITATAFTGSVQAQPGPGVPGMSPLPPGAGRGAIPPPPGGELQQVTAFQGRVVKMNSNDDYVYDGFYMLNGTDSLLVKFPAHLGSQVTGIAKTGTEVSVKGVLHIPPVGVKEISMVSLTANGQTIIDTPPDTAPTPPVETFVKGQGKIISLQADPDGRTTGFMVDNKTILHIPPHIAMQLGAMIQVGSNIAYTGMQKVVTQGEVSAASYAVVHCTTITVNGQQYLVK
jgi:hypothetical protein